jgi:hypothetical protein
MPIAAYLIAASALVIFILGAVHLWFTFVGTKLHPRNLSVQTSMEAEHPVLTRQTTIWKAWVGFNASHSYGAMLFGLVYGYLAVAESSFLSAATFLLVVGWLLLLGYGFLGKRYWFSVPFRGIVLANVLYIVALAYIAIEG